MIPEPAETLTRLGHSVVRHQLADMVHEVYGFSCVHDSQVAWFVCSRGARRSTSWLA